MYRLSVAGMTLLEVSVGTGIRDRQGSWFYYLMYSLSAAGMVLLEVFVGTGIRERQDPRF